jgi:signal transduction histidine kinase
VIRELHVCGRMRIHRLPGRAFPRRLRGEVPMALASTLIQLPLETGRDIRDPFASELLELVAFADGPASGMRRVLEAVRVRAGAAGAEWWGLGEDGALGRLAVSGTSGGVRRPVPLGRAGTVVIFTGRVDEVLLSGLKYIAPAIWRRLNEDQLARAAARLARRNEALDEFASLVAHELKVPLHVAMAAEDPIEHVAEALGLVDLLLCAAGAGPMDDVSADVAECLARAVIPFADQLQVTSDLRGIVPLAAGPLFVILRNLLANAAAAGARHVRVRTERGLRNSRLVVEDDGSGVEGPAGGYATGSRIGLPLCRQIAARSGGVLELGSRVSGGTRAVLCFDRLR